MSPLQRNEPNDWSEFLNSEGWCDNVLLGDGYGTFHFVALDEYESVVE
jgi:hypothetical protein